MNPALLDLSKCGMMAADNVTSTQGIEEEKFS
jgi:hypothetical protein